MNLYINPLGGALLMVAFVVGFLVYQHTRQSPTDRGDVVGAIGCAAAVLTALVLILGGGQPATPAPAPPGSVAPPRPASPTAGP